MPRLFSWERGDRRTAAKHQRERGEDDRPRPRDALADKSGMKNDEDSGLVICPKTFRSEMEESLASLADEIGAQKRSGDGSGHFIVLTPGSIRVKRRGMRGTSSTQLSSDRKAIKGWSRKSRANMVSRFSSLDLSPMMIGNKNALAVMITLTYPGDWLAVAPTASHAKTHLQQFRKRYERRFRRPFYAMWKAEFQRRGAVHFHLFSVSPIRITEFRKWVATTWSEIVNPPTEEERIKHLSAGTAVDLAKGATIETARLVAVYFSKHSSANFGAKEYQNLPPQEWIESGSVGRFWGYWHLKPVEMEARVSEREAVAISRVLRRWFRSKGFTRIERVARVDAQGTITYHDIKKRSERMSHTYGFITLEDSLKIAGDLKRYLHILRDEQAGATTGNKGLMSNLADSLEQ